MKSKIKSISHKFVNQTNGEEHEMVIAGAIGQSGWFFTATSAEDVRNALQDVTASTIRIKLNSGGGDADHGIEIYNYLKDLDKHVIVEVTSLAASAASVIAMGADEVIMRTGSRMMIHEAATFAYGTKQDIKKTLNALETYDESIVSIYQEKTGKTRDEIAELVENETWMTAEEAVEKGFADKLESKKQEDFQEGITDEQLQQIINTVTTSVTNQLKQSNNNPSNEPKQPVHTQVKRKGFIF
ncbi:head maturation protease, ClpP-related [Priestia megaterium]|uniref:head maturation protease, ClpP-related n=1 Tax=Priestia megaterium TaxID=1404 RepID=UPI0005C79BA2|nr:head maturation protease, ClpP-related [Priestia megaterium]